MTTIKTSHPRWLKRPQWNLSASLGGGPESEAQHRAQYAGHWTQQPNFHLHRALSRNFLFP